jgi:protein tyrosine phosphatase (PTP) superfamily phosphohydrolase (DUF442 family)
VKEIILFILVFGVIGCAHKEEKLPNESNVAVTKTLKGHRWGNIYFSGQPSGKALKNLKENGFSTVINLREKNEGKYQENWESKVVKKAGLNYYNIPFSMKKEMTNEYIESVTSKVMNHRKEGKILIHCSSGNRVGVWLGAHFQKDHSFSTEKSLKLAKELGLTNPKAETKLKTYLK